MTSPPRVSIVLPTYNRRARLARVLAGLDGQSAAPDCFEVVIVDDGSTDDTKQWLSQNRERAYAVRAIHQPNGGPARARNTGVAEARGELLLFIDDDVEPTPDLVAEHLRSHDAEKDVVVIGPLASLEHYGQPWVAWEQAKVEAQYAAMLRGDWEPTFRQFWTGNASVSKHHVLAAGGFDPSFLRAEDVELGRRMHERGVGFRFNPAARGLHRAERSLDAWARMHQAYGTLEVQIFGGLGEDFLIEVLAGNFCGIHPLSRWLVGHCVYHPRQQAIVASALKGWLRLAAVTHLDLAAGKVCGALANILYWQASTAALGGVLTARVFERGDEIRRLRRPRAEVPGAGQARA
jgi:glycosyltransferase involved in cell wall biosynthesis